MRNFIVLILLLGIAALFLSATSGTQLRRGQKFPQMQLVDINGKEVQLGGKQEKVYLVDFWATWCAPCRRSMPFLQELHEKYSEKGLVVVGVALESGSESEVRAFVENLGITYHICVPSNQGEVKRRYRVNVFPTMYLVDKKGVIRYAEEGYSDDLREELLRQIGYALNE